MEFKDKLIPGTIQKRYKRFLADVLLENDELITAHTANTGAMTTCWEPGWQVLLSYHENPKRKLKYSLEMTNNGTTWIGVNTGVPNKLAIESIQKGAIPELSGYPNIKPEYKVGKSRIDIHLSNEDESEECFVEIKNVTLLGKDRTALFPDAVSTRGQKHLEELIQLKQQGHRAVMLYIVQREDIDRFSIAKDIDPRYFELVAQAQKEGVEIIAYGCSLSPHSIEIKQRIPYQ